jgi:hypothetical protein
VLKGGDRTVDVGEGGSEMGKDLSSRGPAGACGRQLGRRAARQQRGTDRSLAPVESLPEALPGSAAERTPRGAHRLGERARRGTLEERPQRAGAQAQPPDFVGEPDADGPPAPGPTMPVVAKDPPGPNRSPRRSAIVESGEGTVPDQRAGRLAVRARNQLEPLGEGGPLLLVAVEPAFVAHVGPTASGNSLTVGRAENAEKSGVR